LPYTLPAGHKCTCQRGVTLLGDAAHLKTPFGGNGVNFAMLDAAELAIAIAEHDGADSIEAYEAKICERAAPEAAKALNSLMETFSEAGPPALARSTARRRRGARTPSWSAILKDHAAGAADRRRRGASHED
jgi:2-polyprenyl-6-methoxyphenol hydroxylase-like FAD-dependent oxidoreductase